MVVFAPWHALDFKSAAACFHDLHSAPETILDFFLRYKLQYGSQLEIV